MKKILIISSVIIVLGFSGCGQKACCDNNSKKETIAQTNTPSTAADTTKLVCKLTTEEQMKRGEDLRKTVFKEYEKLNELPEAVELVYADGKKYSLILVEFINTERACCPFFTFDLKFLANSDKVSLTVGGSPKIKVLVKTLIKG